ncbi:MAG: hypothetical protein CL672_00245 [Balneola sp.]|nr:hypothetical protein [Balneola sp.]
MNSIKRIITSTVTPKISSFTLLSLFVLLGTIFSSMVNAQTDTLSVYKNFSDTQWDLEDILTIALANNPGLRRAVLSVEDAERLVFIAYSNVLPDISTSMNYTRNVETPVNFIPESVFDPNGDPNKLVPIAFGTDNNWQGGFTVEQNIFEGPALVGVSTATIFRTVQTENYRATAQNVVTQARQAYYQVLIRQEVARLQAAQIGRLEENLSQNKKRAELGFLDDYDVMRLDVQLSNLRPSLIQAEYDIAEAKRELALIIGIPVQLEYGLKGDLNQFDIYSEQAFSPENSGIKKVDRMTQLPSQQVGDGLDLSQQRGDLRLLQASLNLKDKEIQAEKARLLPVITANYNLQWSAAEPGSPTFFENSARFQTIGLRVSMPLFSGWERISNLQRVQISKKDLLLQQLQAQENASHQVQSAIEQIYESFQIAKARKEAIEQAIEGYNRTQIRLDNGLGSTLELTEALLQVREAELNYAQTVFNYLLAKASYDLAIGRVPLID